MVPPHSGRISPVPPYSRTNARVTRRGLSPAKARLSRRFRLSRIRHWPGPRSLATTSGVSVDVLSSGYLDVSVPRVCFLNLCIQFRIPLRVGFPIRKSADQRLFAPPHGLSQRTTSFIASQRQGIHRIPLRHLIALIIDAHRSAADSFRSDLEGKPKGSIIKDQFASNTPEDVAVMLRPLTEALARRKNAGATGCISSLRCKITRVPRAMVKTPAQESESLF